MRKLSLLLPLVVLVACGPGQPTVATPSGPARARQGIVGGISDHFRTYVVGVGDDQYGWFCSGTVISRRTVLTAGHCYDPTLPNGGITTIYFGEDIAFGSDAGYVAMAVEDGGVVRHPGYDDNTLANDMTLVHLSADAPTQPVPLLRETMTNTPTYIGPNFTFVGYGNDNHSNYDIRRVVTFPIGAIGPGHNFDTDFDATQFYYNPQGKETCDGDSGGPAFLIRNHVERLAGDTSYGDGPPCIVYGVDQRTDAPQIANFIQPTIDQFEGSDPCRADGVCDESCNVGNQLVDPDCAENHCGADGMCVLSCSPVDPDCTEPDGGPADRSGADGICDPAVASDPDCAAPTSTGSSGSTSTSGTSGSTGAAATTGTSGSTGSIGTTGSTAGTTGTVGSSSGTSSGTSSGATTGTSGTTGGTVRGGSSGTGGSGGETKSGGCGAVGGLDLTALLALLGLARRRR